MNSIYISLTLAVVGVVSILAIDYYYLIHCNLPVTSTTSVPILNKIIPDNGTTAGGTTITIYGDNFEDEMLIYFNSTLATDITIISSSKATCVTPAHLAGTVDVKIVKPDDQTFLFRNGFEYL